MPRRRSTGGTGRQGRVVEAGRARPERDDQREPSGPSSTNPWMPSAPSIVEFARRALGGVRGGFAEGEAVTEVGLEVFQLDADVEILDGLQVRAADRTPAGSSIASTQPTKTPSITKTPRSAHCTKRTSPAGSGQVQCSSPFGVPRSVSSRRTTFSPSSPKNEIPSPSASSVIGSSGLGGLGRRLGVRGRGRRTGATRSVIGNSGRPGSRRPDQNGNDAPRPPRRSARPGRGRRHRRVSPLSTRWCSWVTTLRAVSKARAATP